MNVTSSQFISKSGRIISYTEFGDPTGQPLVVSHGTPGSHVFWTKLPGMLPMKGVRFIVPDRPGYGGTILDPRDTLRQYAFDIAELMCSLNIKRYAMLGLSGGAPHVLAAAAWTPDRLSHCGVITPLGPYTLESRGDMHLLLRLTILVAKHAPFLVLIEQLIVAFLVRFCSEVLFLLLRMTLPYADLVICSEKMKPVFLADLPTAYQQWGRGPSYDATIPTAWPIPLEGITIPVTLWISKNDRIIGRMGQYIADRLKKAEIYTIPKEGHFWSLDHMPLIIKQLFENSSYDK